MTTDKKWPLAFATLLLLLTLACSVGGIGVPDVGRLPEGAAATAEGAAQAAATAMAGVTIPAGVVQTAQSAAGDAGGLAATAVALAGEQGSGLLATLQASDFDVQITIDVDALRQKVLDARPDAEGNIRLELTDVELNNAISVRAGRAGQEPALQDPDIMFTGGNLLLIGRVQQPVQGEMRATFQPVVSDGQLRLFLTSVTIGAIPVPTVLLSSVEATINASLATLLSALPGNYRISEMVVGEGTMTIIARPAG